MSVLKDLTSLVPPPYVPTFSPSRGDWELATRRWGRLPQDYVEIASTYGFGCFGRYIWIALPGHFEHDLTHFALRTSRDLLEAFEDGPYESPVFAPEVGGWLPFSFVESGDSICWDTRGNDPDDWPLCFVGGETAYYSGGLADWLYAVATREYRNPRVLPDEVGESFGFIAGMPEQ